MPRNNDSGGSKYTELLPLTIYELARDGYSDAAISKAIGVSKRTWDSWVKNKEPVWEALDRGRSYRPKRGRAQEFILSKLSPEVLAMWHRLEECANPRNSEERAEKHSREPNTADKQYAYVAGLVRNNFNLAAARREAGVEKAEVAIWMRDVRFVELIDQLTEAKKDFFEDALVRGVERDDPSIVLHVNKTVNRDRGYGDVRSVEVSGQVHHAHEVFSFEPVFERISLAARREVLAAMEAIEAEKEGRTVDILPAPITGVQGEVVDAEVVSSDQSSDQSK